MKYEGVTQTIRTCFILQRMKDTRQCVNNLHKIQPYSITFESYEMFAIILVNLYDTYFVVIIYITLYLTIA